MKRILYAGIFCLLSGSCISDKTDTGSCPISEIRFKTTFQTEAYREDRWNEFRLACPEIEQRGEIKSLTYRWDINYKTVSVSKDLVYLCDVLTNTAENPTDFPCRLTVSNEDGATWMDFRLKVTSPYEEGILLLSRYDNKTMLAFKREDKAGEEFRKNVYLRNNPLYPLGTLPRTLMQHGTSLYIGTENPLRVVKLDRKTFELKSVLKYPADKIDFMLGTSDDYYDLIFIGGGRELEFDANQEGIMNMFQQAVDKLYPGIRLAPKAMKVYDAQGRPKDMLTYNNTGGMLFVGMRMPRELYTAEFRGKKLIDIVPCREGQEALVIVYAEDETPDIVHLNPLVPALLSSVSTENSGITVASRFLASHKRSVLYYSVGNEIFAYDYTSEGNFPESPLYTAGHPGDRIRDMVFNGDETMLYVAYDSASGEFKGCVKCFSLTEGKVLWEKTGVAGNIVQMIYKK